MSTDSRYLIDLADRLNLSSITSEADLLDSSKSTDEGLDLDSASDGNSTSIGLEEALAVTLSDTSGDAEDIAERLTEVLIDGHNGKLKTDLALKVTDRSGESKIDSKLAASSKQTAGARRVAHLRSLSPQAIDSHQSSEQKIPHLAYQRQITELKAQHQLQLSKIASETAARLEREMHLRLEKKEKVHREELEVLQAQVNKVRVKALMESKDPLTTTHIKKSLNNILVSESLYIKFKGIDKERRSVREHVSVKVYELVQKLNSTNETLTAEADSLRERLTKVEAERDSFARECDTLQRARAEIQRDSKTASRQAEQTISELESRLETMHAFVTDSKGKLAIFDKIREKADDLEAKRKKLEEENLILGVSEKSSKEEATESKHRSNELEQQVELLRQDKMYLAKELDVIRGNIQDLRSERNRLREKVSDVMKQREEMMEKLAQVRDDHKTSFERSMNAYYKYEMGWYVMIIMWMDGVNSSAIFDTYDDDGDGDGADRDDDHDHIAAAMVKLATELKRIEEKAEAEMHQLRTSHKELFEREIKNLREERDHQTVELDRVRTRLETTSKDLQSVRDTHAKLTVENAQREQELRAARLRDYLKSSRWMSNKNDTTTFTATALFDLIHEETVASMRKLSMQCEMQSNKNDLLKTEFYTLKAESAKREAMLNAENDKLGNKIKGYEQLESEIDIAILTAGEEATALRSLNYHSKTKRDKEMYAGVEEKEERKTAGTEEQVIQSLGAIPTTAQRRMKQALKLAQKLLEKQKEVHVLKEECKNLNIRIREKEEENQNMRKELHLVGQPQNYLISTIQGKEEQLKDAKNACRTLKSQIGEFEREMLLIRKENKQMRKDLQTVLMQGNGTAQLKALLSGLKARKSNEELQRLKSIMNQIPQPAGRRQQQ
eukprot:jgi/Bigna1/81562/fgenesh1_pg.81_\